MQPELQWNDVDISLFDNVSLSMCTNTQITLWNADNFSFFFTVMNLLALICSQNLSNKIMLVIGVRQNMKNVYKA